MEEIWKPVKGVEYYEVSNLGRVRSIDHYVRRKNNTKSLYKGRILNPAINNSGYLTLGVLGSVHRLVAKAFIPNPNNLSDVNHKDKNRMNNCVDNLEWMSHADNMNYSRGYKHSTHPVYETYYADKIVKIKKILYKGEMYDSQTILANTLGVSCARISQLKKDGKISEVFVEKTIKVARKKLLYYCK